LADSVIEISGYLLSAQTYREPSSGPVRTVVSRRR